MTRRITPTYVLLNQITLSANTSAVTFSNLPQNYSDLIMVFNGSGTNTATNSVQFDFNGDTNASNYPIVGMHAYSGNGYGSYTATSANMGLIVSGVPTVNTSQLFDYSTSDKHTSFLSRGNLGGGDTYVRAVAGRWANTAPVISVRFFIDTGASFVTGSTFSLYGVYA